MAHIVLAEDDLHIAKIYTKWLESEGHTVTHAPDGLQGWNEAAFNSKPNLLITDIMMPEADGEVMVELVRAFDPDLPVVVVTGLADTERLARLEKEPNIRKVLRKPVNRNDLLACVKEAIA